MNNNEEESYDFNYKNIFETFLKHTDQKQITKEWMYELLDTLPEKNTFIDIGAGEGSSTKHYAHLFKQTICIEPNPLLAKKLKVNIPNAIIKPHVLDEINHMEYKANLILCAHVFYYLDEKLWLGYVKKMISWLDEEGVLVIILQSSGTDCRKLANRFTGGQKDLRQLKQEIEEKLSQCEVRLERRDARIIAQDHDTIKTILKLTFMSIKPFVEKISYNEKEFDEYIDEHFKFEHNYIVTCDQDFLVIRLKNKK
jgi:hypothetical protein